MTDRIMDTATKYVILFSLGYFGGHVAQAIWRSL